MSAKYSCLDPASVESGAEPVPETASRKRLVRRPALTGSIAFLSAVVLLATGFTTTPAHSDGPGFRPWIGGGIGVTELEPGTSEIAETVTDENSTGFRGMLGLDLNLSLIHI